MKKTDLQNFSGLPLFKGLAIKYGRAGIKSKTKLDLSLIVFDNYANVASVITKSKTCAANISWIKKIRNYGTVKVLFVNSGNANAYTGELGVKNVKTIINYLSEYYSCKKQQVIISSTGVIGEQLPLNKIMNFLPNLLKNKTKSNFVKKNDWKNFATSIMTTDTFPKVSFKQSKIGNKKVNIIGVAKGSGMIAPNMATMLGYIFTDALLPVKLMRNLLKNINEKTFNSITVDSDTSTNDMVSFFSTREIDCKVKSINDQKLGQFKIDLESVSKELAKKIVFDGEGATKIIEITVREAKSYSNAKKIGLSVANSPLVKTAIAGEDANWGRIIMAIGKSDVPVKQNKISLKFGNNVVIKEGELQQNYDESKIANYLKRKNITIIIELGLGKSSATVWTCDLTKEYIAINADYRS